MNEIDTLANLLLARGNDLYRAACDFCAEHVGEISTEDATGIGAEVQSAYQDIVVTVLGQFGWHPQASSPP